MMFLFIWFVLSPWQFMPTLWLFPLPPTPPPVRTVHPPITGPGLVEPNTQGVM